MQVSHVTVPCRLGDVRIVFTAFVRNASYRKHPGVTFRVGRPRPVEELGKAKG
jgi:hypothetical protein